MSTSGSVGADDAPSGALTRLSNAPTSTRFVDPSLIAPLTCIRVCSETGVRNILESLVHSGWDRNRSGIYVIEITGNRDILGGQFAQSCSNTPAPLYGCVDGWHRIQAIRRLLAKTDHTTFDPTFPLRPGTSVQQRQNVTAADSPNIFPDWPVDVGSGHVSQIQVVLLEGAIDLATLVLYAMHLNHAASYAVAEVTYIDILSSGKRYSDVCRQSIERREHDGGGAPATFTRADYTREMKSLYGLSEGEASTDFHIIKFMNSTPGLFDILLDARQSSPKVANFSMRRDILQLLARLGVKRDGTPVPGARWAAEAMIRAQQAFETALKEAGRDVPPTGGPARSNLYREVLGFFLSVHEYTLPISPLVQRLPGFEEPIQLYSNDPVLEPADAVSRLVAIFVRNGKVVELKRSIADVQKSISEVYRRRPITPLNILDSETPVQSPSRDVERPSDGATASTRSPVRPTPEQAPQLHHFMAELDVVADQRRKSRTASLSPRAAVSPSLQCCPSPSPRVSSSPSPHGSSSQSRPEKAESAADPLVPGAQSQSTAQESEERPALGFPYLPGAESEPAVITPSVKRKRTEVSAGDVDTTALESTLTEMRNNSGSANWPPARREDDPVLTRDERERQLARREAGQRILEEAAATVQKYRLRSRNRDTEATVAPYPSVAERPPPARRPSRRQHAEPRKYAFDDDDTPLPDTARHAYMESLSAEKEKSLGEVLVPDVMGSKNLVRGLFAARNEMDRTRDCVRDVEAWIERGGPEMTRCLVMLALNSLEDTGFALLDGVIPGETVRGEGPTLRDSVDEVLAHFLSCFHGDRNMCCKDKPESQLAWNLITNRGSIGEGGSASDRRYQTPRAAITQHLEAFHSSIFAHKVLVDVCIAVLVDRFAVPGRGQLYSLPKTGARLLLSATGCSAQSTHTDFADRSAQRGVPVDDPSFFVVMTGNQGASLQVVPGSHKIAARVEHLLKRGGHDESAKVMADALCDFAKIKPLKIPPYSLFIARGDLVHGGDAHPETETESNIRFHTYAMLRGKDKIDDHLFFYSFD